jgi:ABC-type sugar transport system substrate-binding protein
MKKWLVVILALSMLIVTLVGCATASTTTEVSENATAASEATTTVVTEASDKVMRVGFVNLADSDENCLSATQTFKSVVESDEFKAKIGSDVNVEVIAADSNADIAKQTANVETLLAKGVDYMFIIGVDTEGNSTAVKACNEAGVPVFMVATEATEGDYKFVGFSENDFGAGQGQYVAKNLKEGGTVVYIGGTPGREAAVMREESALGVIEAERPDIKIIANQTGNFKTEDAMKVTEDFIQAYGSFDCLIAADNSMALGAIEALKAAQILDKVMVVGCIVPGTWDADLVKNGEMSYGVYVSFKVLGETCADVAAKMYNGESVDDITYMKMLDVDQTNVNEYFK